MKIIFFGTSEFALSALAALRRSGYQIPAVVTQPDKAAGRKQLPLPSPVKLLAQKLNLPVLQPGKLSAKDLPEADAFVVASYGKIIPKKILDLPPHKTLNLHPSLLPRYRGPSPIQASMLNGDPETGVSLMILDEAMDHGPILATAKLRIPGKPGYREVHDQLAKLAAQLLVDTLPQYLSGTLKATPQEHSQASFTRLISKADGRIDWGRPAQAIERQVRAYEAWPVAWTTIDGKNLKVYRADALEKEVPGSPGEIVGVSDGLQIRCGQGVLKISRLQLAGAKKLDAADFIRGKQNLLGKILA